MWAALRSDFKEFVSTVADESTTVLSAIDSKLQDEETRERLEREQSGDDIDGEVDEENDEKQGLIEEGGTPANVVIGDSGDVTYIDRRSGYEVTGIVSTPEDEAARLRELEETYTEPLLPGGEGERSPKASELAAAEEDEEEIVEEEKGKEGVGEEGEGVEGEGVEDAAEPKGEVGTAEPGAKDVSESTPVTEDTISSPPPPSEDPAYDDVHAFLSTFDIETKTDEISAILVQYPDTVMVHFENLVPTVVSYEQFWQRYYYRCDPERIAKEWEAERERMRKARADAISGSINAVTGLFGGAVKAVSNIAHAGDGVDGEGNRSAYEKYQAEHEQQQQTGESPSGGGVGGMLGFGSGRRPPFVMNTAVSDEYDEMVEEDDDEELGWDDDDEDEDEEEETESEVEESEDHGHEEIVFHSSDGKGHNVEELTRQLSQTEAERDVLHETIALQTKEIADLKLREGAPPSPAAAAPSDDSAKEIERLKMALFEKDSELAALKASLDDTHDDHKDDKATKNAAKIAAQDRELKRKETDLTSKDDEIARLKNELEQASEQAKSDTAALEEARSMITQLRSDFETIKQAAAASAAEVESLRKSAASSKDSSASEVATARKEVQEARDQIQSLTTDLDDTKHNLEFTSRRANHLDEEMVRLKEEIEKKEEEHAKMLKEEIAKVRAEHEGESTDTNPSSFSSGVKIGDQPGSPTTHGIGVAAAKIADDDEEDDWGDSWGDEDD